MYTDEERALIASLNDRIQKEKAPEKLIMLVEQLTKLVDAAHKRQLGNLGKEKE